jgi:MraZ protein
MRHPSLADGGRGTSLPRAAGWTDWVARETFFVGHQLNAVDSKGRVSVPAAFRTQLERRAQEDGKDAVKELMIAPSPKGDRLRAFDPAGVRDRDAKFTARVADLPAAERADAEEDAFRDELATATQVAFDSAGRMVLPPILRKLGQIGDLAFFVGVRDYFEILSPENARVAFANNPMMLGMLDHYLEEREA